MSKDSGSLLQASLCFNALETKVNMHNDQKHVLTHMLFAQLDVHWSDVLDSILTKMENHALDKNWGIILIKEY